MIVVLKIYTLQSKVTDDLRELHNCVVMLYNYKIHFLLKMESFKISFIPLKFPFLESVQNHTCLQKNNITELVPNVLHWVHANP